MAREMIWLAPEMVKEPGFYLMGRSDDREAPHGVRIIEVYRVVNDLFIIWESDHHQNILRTDPEVRWFGPIPKITW